VTVAAIVLVPDSASALADADGESALRRIVRSAWAGGAFPIVAVTPTESPTLSAAVADLPVTIAVAETEGIEHGIAWFAYGLRAATAAVAETTAGMLWPFRYGWVDPETVTSLVEAFGAAPDAIARPAFEGRPGFPVLVPATLEPRLSALVGLHAGEALARLIAEGVEQRLLELGDPGIVYDVSTPRQDLPPYQGPSRPAGGPTPEWNEDLGAQAEPSAEASG
jgi:CTP:molybdopterin cytidylyltransferase MocA